MTQPESPRGSFWTILLWLSLLALGTLLLGCGSPPPSGPIIALDAFELLSGEDDPFADHRPEGQPCGGGGWGIEAGVFEVETDICSYATFTQPLLRDVPSGEELRITLWHLGLFADPPAEGHVLLAVNDLKLFEVLPSIPSSAEIWDEVVVPDEDLLQGAPLLFHIHNHGANSWRLGGLTGTQAE